MKINKIVSAVSATTVLALAAFQVFAAGATTSGGGVGIDNPLGDVELQDIIQKIINFLFGLALLICPIFIIWGGFEIATAAGADTKIKEGRQKITYSLVGLVIMALASAFVKVIKTILGVN
jgi:hypothetical protein